MSDFVSGGWSLFVAGLTVVSLIACLILLVIASRREVMADDNTTGHVWDEDLRELNNPLPRWWMWLFVITVVFAAVYLALYPGLGTYQGSLKWSSAGQHQAETDKHFAAMAPVYAKYQAMSPADMAKDAAAMGIGERLYLNNCAACHGSDGRGSKGFPNLADGDWLGGQGADYVAKVIKEGRMGVMPPLAAAVGTPEDVKNVAQYVLSLSGSSNDSIAASLGQTKFATCAACHGANAKGNQALGAPNLTDKIWLHGGGEAAIVRAITQGINNNMPAQGRLLTDDQIGVLAAYVLNLGNAATTVSQK